MKAIRLCQWLFLCTWRYVCWGDCPWVFWCFLFILLKHCCIPRGYPPWPWCMILCVPGFCIYTHRGYWSIASLSVSMSLCLCACMSLSFARVMLASQSDRGAVLSLCIVWNSFEEHCCCSVGFRSGGIQQWHPILSFLLIEGCNRFFFFPHVSRIKS